MDRELKQDREVVLRDWRTRILNGFLIVVAIASVPAFIVTILRSLNTPSFWSITIPFSVAELLLIVLAIYLRLDYRIRVVALLVIGYAATILSVRLGGFAGGAPLFLFF